jgi:hypothetical protein
LRRFFCSYIARSARSMARSSSSAPA